MTTWENKRHIIIWFADYVKTGCIAKPQYYRWKLCLIDTLPNWSRKITESYLCLRKKEKCAPSTIDMCRSSCIRFFLFLDSKGINSPSEITPIIVKEFHDADLHDTPQGKNAYAVRVRKLLEYMAVENLVPKNLYLAISTQCAPECRIVTIMDEAMISAVYEYRETVSSPMELRNTAIVMIGLRMGLRASDVVNLKVSDFNFGKRTLSFIQVKTRKEITLPIPVDVGNSVYKYITQGRPVSDLTSAGFIFIKHKSPYSSLSRCCCARALKNVLATKGLKLSKGQGFHVTRRTYATRLQRLKKRCTSKMKVIIHSGAVSFTI